MSMLCCCSILLFSGFIAGLCAAEGDGAAAPSVDFRTVAVKTAIGKAKTVYAAQSLGPMLLPVADEIQIADVTLRIKSGEKGRIEVDYGAKRPKELKKTTTLKVPVSYGEHEEKLTIEFIQDKEGQWFYANRSILALIIPGASGPLAVIDANGNGRYDDVHVDGVAWPDQRMLFPLPKADEHWALPQLEVKDFVVPAPGTDGNAAIRPLGSITPNGLAVLTGANQERVKLGITPRPEDPALTADLAKHCHWMAVNKELSHPEKTGSPAFSAEGHAAGMRSILSMGRGPEQVATGFMNTLYHRFDVIRADLKGFGVGSEGNYSGIDGRTTMMHDAPKSWWPILCPMPEQTAIPLQFSHESPDPINGDKQAGWPITVVFAESGAKLLSHKLQVLGKDGTVADVACYTFDASDRFLKFSDAIGLIPKDPLMPGSIYQVMMEADVKGKIWKQTWKFATR